MSSLQQLRLHLRSIGDMGNVESKAEEYIRHTEWYSHLTKTDLDSAKRQVTEDFIKWTEYSLRQVGRG